MWVACSQEPLNGLLIYTHWLAGIKILHYSTKYKTARQQLLKCNEHLQKSSSFVTLVRVWLLTPESIRFRPIPCVGVYVFMLRCLQAFPVICLMTAWDVIGLDGAELAEVHGSSHLTCWREPLCLFVLRIIIPGLNWSAYWTWLGVPLFIQYSTFLKISTPYRSYSRGLRRIVGDAVTVQPG